MVIFTDIGSSDLVAVIFCDEKNVNTLRIPCEKWLSAEEYNAIPKTAMQQHNISADAA